MGEHASMSGNRQRWLGRVVGAAVLASLALTAVDGRACPFCTVESQTLSEELHSVDAAVLAKLVKEAAPLELGAAAPAEPGAGTALGDATFEIVDVLRGKPALGDTKQIQVTYFGPANRQQVFLITGIGTDPIGWTTPLSLSSAAVDYIHRLDGVAASGPDRLAFFQDYLEHKDRLLAQDAYDEFARAPYSELQAFAGRMHHDQLVAWIGDPEVSPSGRRLYLAMLGACGTKADLPMLEAQMISDYAAKKPLVEALVCCGLASGGPVGLVMWPELVDLNERGKKLGLDALVACYLALRGPEGLDLVDQRFLKDPHVEYGYVYSTIMALRFHGESTDVLPRPRLLASMRLLLDNQEFADQVIPDLARWEDWSVLDRLVEMFKSSDKNTYVRQPIVTYLTVASEQEGVVGQRATAALAELEALDPEAVRQARSLSAFGFLARARAGSPGAGATRPAEEQVLLSGTTDSDNVDIPDPADYETSDPAPAAKRTATVLVADAVPTPSGAADVQPTPTKDKSAATEQSAAKPPAAGSALDFAAEPVPDAPPVAASPPREPHGPLTARDFLPPNRWWIAGVPLGAAVLLMGVYWLILRSGTV
jgi:hypothetical protein